MFLAQPPSSERPSTSSTTRRAFGTQPLLRDTKAATRFARLHPSTAEKFRIHWKRVGSAFHETDTDHNGRIIADELKAMLHKFSISLNSDEFKHLWECFDTDRSGSIDYNEFCDVMSHILEGNASGNEYAETNGVSLNIRGPCSITVPKRPVFNIDATWNNRYRQTLHSNGEPYIAAAVCGAWYFEDRDKRHKEVIAERSGKTFFPPASIQQWDKDLGTPEMTALMTGRFYGDEHGRSLSTPRSATANLRHWVAANKRMPHEYSEVLRTIVANSRPNTSGTRTTVSPRTKRTRVSTTANPARLPVEMQAQARQDRADEFLRTSLYANGKLATHNHAPIPPPQQPSGPGGRSPRVSMPLPGTVPAFDTDLQSLQRSAYRCNWASPRVDVLQRAYVQPPRTALRPTTVGGQ